MRNNEFSMKLRITDIFGCRDKAKFDKAKHFAKFEKFIPHSIIIPSFMTIGSQMPELDRGASLPPPLYKKIGSQNTETIDRAAVANFFHLLSCNFKIDFSLDNI